MTAITRKLPTLEQLVQDDEKTLKLNQLTVFLNQNPPAKWLRAHPNATTKNDKGETVPSTYLPIDKVEFMLTRIFTRWWTEVLDTKIMANSVTVTVRLFAVSPLDGAILQNDGVGAAPIQTDKGKGAMDWNFAKASGVQMALPAAKSYATKDAAEGFGKIFGRDLNRRDLQDYGSILKDVVTKEQLSELYDLKSDACSDDMKVNIERALTNNETNLFTSLFKQLQSL